MSSSRSRLRRPAPIHALAAIAAAALLAGCGGAASPGAPPRTSAPASAAASAPASAAAKPAASASPTPVKVSYNTAAATDLPFMVAEQEHYFEAEKLAVTMVSMTPQVAIAALSKGEIDFMNSPTNSIQGATNGLPFKVVWDSWRGAAWSIIGKKDISSPAQLRGKIVATNNPGTAPYAYLRAGLQKNGMSISDVQFLPVAGTSAVYASIIAGKVDAGVLSTPSEGQAQEQGFHEILFLGDLLELPSNGLSTTSSYLAQHRPAVTGMIRGMVKAENWIKAHPDETQAIIVQKLGTSPSVAKKTYDRMAPLLTKTGETSELGIQQNIELLEEATGKKITMDPKQFADFGPLHEVQAEQK